MNIFLSQFINGLKQEIQVYVLQHHPPSLLDAYELAIIQEYTLKCAERKERKLENTSITAAVVESTFMTEFEVTGDPDDVDDPSVAGDYTAPSYALPLSHDNEQIQDTMRGAHSSHFTHSSLKNDPPMEQCVLAKVLNLVVIETVLCNAKNGVVEHTAELENNWPYTDTELCSCPKDAQVIILGKGGTDKSSLLDEGSPESATVAIAHIKSILESGMVNIALSLVLSQGSLHCLLFTLEFLGFKGETYCVHHDFLQDSTGMVHGIANFSDALDPPLLILMLHSLSNPWHFIVNGYVPSVPPVFNHILLQLMGLPMILVCRQIVDFQAVAVLFRLQSVLFRLQSYVRPPLASIPSSGLTCMVLNRGGIHKAVVVVGITKLATTVQHINCFDLRILLLPWSTKQFFCGKSLVLLVSVITLFSMSVHLGFLGHMAWAATVTTILAQTPLQCDGDLLCWFCFIVHAAAMSWSYVPIISYQFHLVGFFPCHSKGLVQIVLVLSFMGCQATSFRGYIPCKDNNGFNSDNFPCLLLNKGGTHVGSLVSSEALFSVSYMLGIPCDLSSYFVLSEANNTESQWWVQSGIVFRVLELLPILQELWLIACFFSIDMDTASNDLMHQFRDFLVNVCIVLPGYCCLDIALTVQTIPILVLREICIGVPMVNNPKVLCKLTLPWIIIFLRANVGHQDARTTDDCKAKNAVEIVVLKDTVFYTSYRVSAAAVEKYAEVSHQMGLIEWSASVPSIQLTLNSMAFANFDGVVILKHDIIYNVGAIVSRYRYAIVLYVICFDPGIVQASFMFSTIQTPIVSSEDIGVALRSTVGDAIVLSGANLSLSFLDTEEEQMSIESQNIMSATSDLKIILLWSFNLESPISCPIGNANAEALSISVRSISLVMRQSICISSYGSLLGWNSWLYCIGFMNCNCEIFIGSTTVNLQTLILCWQDSRWCGTSK